MLQRAFYITSKRWEIWHIYVRIKEWHKAVA